MQFDGSFSVSNGYCICVAHSRMSSISQFAFNILVWIIYKCNKRKCVPGNALRHHWRHWRRGRWRRSRSWSWKPKPNLVLKCFRRSLSRSNCCRHSFHLQSLQLSLSPSSLLLPRFVSALHSTHICMLHVCNCLLCLCLCLQMCKCIRICCPSTRSPSPSTCTPGSSVCVVLAWNSL